MESTGKFDLAMVVGVVAAIGGLWLLTEAVFDDTLYTSVRSQNSFVGVLLIVAGVGVAVWANRAAKRVKGD